jgi:hypothetical protein
LSPDVSGEQGVFGYDFRRKTRGAGRGDQSKQAVEKTKRRRPLGMIALEPRMMYDGAAVATVAADVHTDTAHADASSAASAAPDASHAAPAPAPTPPAPSNDADTTKTSSATDTGSTSSATTAASHEIVIIDSQVPDIQTVINGIKPGDQIFVLDPDKDGVKQIADILAANDLHDLSAIQIISHGGSGEVILGSTTLTDANVAEFADQLGAIGQSLAPGGDILLYGCDVASNVAGQDFLSNLSHYTGADIAASTDATGSAALGGDWTLEASTGTIEAGSPFIDGTLADYPDLLTGAPVIDLNGAGTGNDVTVSFTEQTPQLIAPLATITDVGSTTLNSLTVTLTSRPDGDSAESLSLNSAATAAASGLTVGYTASTGLLSISGTASLATYQSILDGIQYNDTSNTPDTTARTLNVSIYDGVSATTVSFQAQTPFNTGSTASIATADLNGDGILDLVTVDHADSNIKVELGNGSGGFGTALTYTTGVSPQGIVIADFNGDGKLDIATANDTGASIGSVSVFLGTGTGTFGTAINTTVTPGAAYALAVADFNGDGKLDLAVTDFNPAKLSILLGDGTGGFTDSLDLATDSRPTSVAVGDFDGDGKPDIVVAPRGNPANAVVDVFLNTGNGTFANKVTYATGTGPWAVAVGDVNGDGKLDIVTANGNVGVGANLMADNTVSVLLGTGTGTFGAKSDFTVGSDPQSVVLGDFNGDGKLDIATGNVTGDSVSVLLNTGSNTGGAASFGTSTDFATGATEASIVSGDFNRDGHLDLATAQGGQFDEVFLNNSAANVSATQHTTVNVTAVNDAPAAVAPGTHYNATEQTDLNLRNTGLSVSDVDGGSGSETVTLSVAEGVITIAAGDSGITGLTNNGTSAVSFSGTIAQINALLKTSAGTIVYNDNLDAPSASVALTLTIHDNGNTGTGGDLSALAQSTIDVTAVNDPPGITSGSTASVAEGTSTSTVVYTAVATDPDGDTLTYGLTGTDAGAFNINASTGAVTFKATPDFETQNSYSFNVTATDPSMAVATKAVIITITDLAPVISPTATASIDEGVAANSVVYTATAADPAGGTVTYSLTGADAGAFAVNSSTGVVTINASPDFEAKNSYSFTINASDASGQSGTQAVTLNINNVAPMISSLATASVNEGVAANSVVYMAIAADPAGGTVSYSLTGADAGAFVINSSTGAVTIKTTPDFETKNSYSFTINASDGTLTSTEAVTLSVNDLAPVISPLATASVNEGVASNTAVYTAVAADPAGGTVTYSIAGTDAAAFTINSSSGVVTINASPDYVAKNSYSFDVKASDPSGQFTTRTVTLTVNEVNQAPVLSGVTGITVLEQIPSAADASAVVADRELDLLNGGAGNYAGASLLVARASGANAQDTFSFGGSGASFTVDSVNHQLLSGGQIFATYSIPSSGVNQGSISISFTSQQTAATTALVNNVLDHIQYTNLSDTPPASVSLHYSFNDGNTGAQGAGGNGTTSADAAVNITPVNDAPSGADNTVTILQAAPYTFAAADFGFNDVDGNNLSAVIIDVLPLNGTLKDNGVTVTVGQAISAFDISVGRLVFTPSIANGSASLKFQVKDGGGTANGGVDTDPTQRTFAFNIVSVSQAPAGTDATVTTNEDTTYTFTAANFGFSDPNDSPADTFAGVVITTLPTGAGTFTDNGTAVTAGHFVSLASINGGLLKFTPAANDNGTGFASFTFQVQDTGSAANGGANLDPTPNTITINVTPVNDAPTATGDSYTVTANTTVTVPTAAGVLANDADLDGNTLTATLVGNVSHGALTLNSDGSFVYTPTAGYSGADSFTYRASDGSAQSGTTTVNLTVSATPAVDGQLWYITSNDFNPNPLIGHINSDGSNSTQALTNGTTGIDIVVDSAAGYYFVVDTTTGPAFGTHSSDPTAVSVIAYRISDNTQVSTVKIADDADQDEVNTLAIDPANHTLYVAKWGVDLAHSGIEKITYNPTTGALGSEGMYAVNGQSIANASSSTVAGLAVNDIRSISLDLTNRVIYYTVDPNGYDIAPFHAQNAVYVVSMDNPNAVPVQLTSSVQFPAGSNTGGGGTITTTDPNGLIGQVVVDAADNLVFFTTAEFSSPANGGTGHTPAQDALWYVTTNGGANQTAQKVTGITLDYPGEYADIQFDPVKRQLYISDQSQGGNGHPSRVDIAQLDSTGHGVTSVSTFTISQLTNVANPGSLQLINGMYFASLPSPGTIANATFTEGAAATLASSLTLVNPTTGDLTGASVTIANGALTGDVLTATTAGTSISANYNATTHVLTLTGRDSAAHYQQVLRSVQFNNTTDDPTNGAATGSRTISWTVTNNLPNVAASSAIASTEFLTVNAVNDAPVNSVPSSRTVAEDTNLVFSSANGNAISISDADASGGNESVTLSVLHGTLTLGSTTNLVSWNGNGSGTVTVIGTVANINAALNGLAYKGVLNFNGADTLTVHTSDNGHSGSGNVLTDQDTVAITVTAVNDAPVATADSYTASGNTALTVAAAQGVLTNDSDADGDALTAVQVTGPSHASSFTLNANGSFNYTAANGFVGVDTFTYKANDGQANSNIVTVSITVQGSPLTAAGDSYTTLEDTPFSVAAAQGLLVNDTDSQGAALTVTAVNGTDAGVGQQITLSSGALLTVRADGSFDYSPGANVNGNDSFSYTVSDGVNSSTATVGVAVTAVNDAPSFTAGTNVTVAEDAGAQTIAHWATGISAGPNESGQALNFIVSNDNGSLFSAAPTVAADGTLTFTTATNANGSATVTIRLHDNGGTSDNGVDQSTDQTFTITVTPVNDAPTAATSPGTTAATEQVAVVVDNGITVDDIDSDTLASAKVSITGNFQTGQDVLAFANTDATAMGNIAGSYDAATGVLSLLSSGNTATKAQWQAALQTVTYTDTSDSPSIASRTVSFVVNDGSLDSVATTKLVSVAAVNDAPTLATPISLAGSPGSPITVGGSGAGEILFADVDSAGGAEQATFTVTQGTLSAISGGNVTVGGTATALTLTGAVADLNAYLAASNVTYTSSINDTIHVVLDDQGHTGAPGAMQASADINAVFDIPPVIGGLSPSAAFTEGGASVVLSNGVTLSDADAPAGDAIDKAVIKITNGLAGDVLDVGNFSGIPAGQSVTYDAATFTLTLTGADTLADYEQVLQSVSFVSTSSDPTNGGANTSRTVSWTVYDNLDVPSASQTTSVGITGVNNAPVNVLPGAQTINEDVPLIFGNGSGITISDVDAGTGNETVTLSVTQGILTLTDRNGALTPADMLPGVTAFTSGAASISLTGTVSGINAALVGLTYTSVADYNGADTLTITTNDNGNTPNTPLQATDTLSISITPVADIVADSLTTNEDTAITANLITGTNGASADNFENADRAITDVTQGAHGSVTFLADGTVTYTPDADYNGNDSFTYTVTSGGVTEVATATVTINPVADIVADSLTTNEDNAISANLITGTNGASADNFENADRAITDVTQGVHGSVTFLADGTVTYTPDADYYGTDSFNYTVTSGGVTETAAVSLTINAVNDAPVLDAGAAQAAFTESGAAVALSPGLTLSDVDSANLSSATVVIGGGFSGDGDALSAVTSGTSISAAFDAPSHTLTLSGTDTLANYEQVLRSVSFSSPSDNPTNFGGNPTRTITWSITDVDETSAAHLNQTTLDSSSVNITPVNDAPVLAGVPVSAAFTERQTLAVGTGLTISDVDNLSLAGATVQITAGGFAGDGDVLAADVSGTTITAAYDSATGTLQLSGTDTLANYQQVLHSVTFSSGANPTNFADANPTRTLTWTVDDGQASSHQSVAQTTAVTLTAINDAPVIAVGSTAVFDLNQGGAAITLSPTLSVSDVDNTTLAGAVVQIVSGGTGKETLAANVSGTAITVSFDAATETLTLTGVDTVGHYKQVLASVSYVSTTQDPTSQTISWTVNDGALNSVVATSTLTVVPADPAHISNSPAGTPADGPGNSSPTDSGSGTTLVTDVRGDGGTTGSSNQSTSFIVVHSDVQTFTPAGGDVAFQVSLSSLAASLTGPPVSVVASLSDGSPLPDWLTFDPATGTFTGHPPDGKIAALQPEVSDDDITTASTPADAANTITITIDVRDAAGNVATQTFTIKLSTPHTELRLNDRPSRHAANRSLPFDTVKRYTGSLHQLDLAALGSESGLHAPADAGDLPQDASRGDRVQVGRAGLSEQINDFGWRGMHARRNALLASLQQRTGQ